MHIHNHSLVDCDLSSGDMRVLKCRQELVDSQVSLLEPSVDKIIEKIIIRMCSALVFNMDRGAFVQTAAPANPFSKTKICPRIFHF